MQLSDDKTIEFPICDVNHVMGDIVKVASVSPTNPTHPWLAKLNKQLKTNIGLDDKFTDKKHNLDNLDYTEIVMGAENHFNKELPDSVVEKMLTPRHIIDYMEKTNHTKAASLVVRVDYAAPDSDKSVYFIKEAAANELAIEQLEDRAIILHSQLIKTAAEIGKDSAWLDKMSCIQVENFDELSVLISGERKQLRDFAGVSLFKEAQLTQVKSIVALYKEAKEIVAESARRKGLQKRASGLVKEAFFGAAARGIGKAIGATAMAPIKAITTPISTAVSGVAKTGYNKLVGTKAGQAAHLPKANITKTQAVVASGAAASTAPAISAATDIYTYKASGGPGFNSNGTSRNAWDALQ
jgi:acyl carrier protein